MIRYIEKIINSPAAISDIEILSPLSVNEPLCEMALWNSLSFPARGEMISDKTYVPSVFKRYTNNLEAYNLYLKGRYIWSTNRQKDMISFFNKALEIDPNYALAYLGLAEAHDFIGFFSVIQ